MSIYDYLRNPFASTAGAISGTVAAGKRKEKENDARIQQLTDADWLQQQAHGRSMEFMQAQHGNVLELEKFRGGEGRRNMAAARKHGLTEFSNEMRADGGHSTSFKLDHTPAQSPLGATPPNPLVGASIRSVDEPISHPGASTQSAAAPASHSGVQSTDQKAPSGPQGASKSPKKDLPPPAFSGAPLKAKGPRQAMLPGTKP